MEREGQEDVQVTKSFQCCKYMPSQSHGFEFLSRLRHAISSGVQALVAFDSYLTELGGTEGRSEVGTRKPFANP